MRANLARVPVRGSSLDNDREASDVKSYRSEGKAMRISTIVTSTLLGPDPPDTSISWQLPTIPLADPFYLIAQAGVRQVESSRRF